MALLESYSFEETDFSAFASANGWTAGGTTPVLDTAYYYVGTQCVAFKSNGGSSCLMYKSSYDKNEFFGRFLIYLTDYPPSDVQFLSNYDINGYGFYTYVQTTGRLALITYGVNRGSTSGTLPLNQWCEIFWRMNFQTGNSICELKSVAGTISDTGAIPGGNVWSIRAGIGDNLNATLYMDSWALNDTEYPASALGTTYTNRFEVGMTVGSTPASGGRYLYTRHRQVGTQNGTFYYDLYSAGTFVQSATFTNVGSLWTTATTTITASISDYGSLSVKPRVEL